MERPYGDDMILSYNDTVLRRSDLDILSRPRFLNDRIIEFFFSYLSSNYPSDDIHLIPPSISFWLQNCSDVETLKSFVQPLNLPSKNLVLFPVNNNDDVTQAEAGTHWSLLVFYRPANVFVHHDSCNGLNNAYAKMLYNSVVGFIGNADSNITYIEHKSSPQQDNGYDCGVFVCAIAKVICSWYECNRGVDKEHLWFSNVQSQVSLSLVSELRKDILDLIKGLISQG